MGMGKKLYVGGLDYGIDDDALADLFGNHGGVEEAKVIRDRDTNKSKGFGFVTMDTEEGAADARSALDQTEFAGRKLRVDEARDRDRGEFQNRDRGGGGGGGGRGRGAPRGRW